MNDLIIRKRKRTILSKSSKLPKQDNEINFVSTNKFSALEDSTKSVINDYMLIDDDTSHKQQQTKQSDSNQAQTKRKTIKRPPPLVAHGAISEHKALVDKVKDIVQEKCFIKYHENYTEVFTTTGDHYKLLKGMWKQNKLPFHTYTKKGDQRRTYVIRGLHEKTDRTDILKELKELGFPAFHINRMKNTSRVLFMATFFVSVKISVLAQKVRCLEYTRLSWEPHINKNKISQSHRCQEWGHATFNCYANPVCMKCADGHLTSVCHKSKDIPTKCVNWDKSHPANSKNCEEYKKRLAWIVKNGNKKQRRGSTPLTILQNSSIGISRIIRIFQYYEATQGKVPLLKCKRLLVFQAISLFFKATTLIYSVVAFYFE